MEWIREWIMQIAGVTVLSAICEVIMPNGEMKKYVRPVIGLVLVFAVIKPVLGFSEASMDAFRTENAQYRAEKLRDSLDETECREIIEIYQKKLCQNIENELKSGGVRGDVTVKAEVDGERGESFGCIASVTVEGCGGDSEEAALIRKIIKREFGVDSDAVRFAA